MRRFAQAALLLMTMTAVAEDARRTGTIRIIGRVSEMASLRFHSASTHGEAVQGSNAGGQDSALDYTLNLGDVGVVPGRDNGVRGGAVKLMLRANSSYVLTATVAGRGFQPGQGQIGLDDIGFGVPSQEIAVSGPRARMDNTVVVDPAKYDYRPLAAPVSSGVPQYRATLADLAAGVPVLKGDRISYGGTANSPQNALLVSTEYAVHPQLFRRNDGFEAVVTYTLTTP